MQTSTLTAAGFIRIIAMLLVLLPLGSCAAGPGTKLLDSEILDLPISEMQDRLNRGEISSLQLVDSYQARISAYDQKGPKLNAIITINPEARQRAKQLDEERARQGARGPLHGIPILIKDNYETADMQTGVGSKIFAGWLPPSDATIVARLREAGAIITAKTNTHEFAMGHATHGSLFGQTRNPYNPEHIPGGSSGGTGAAVAANYAPAGFGSDTCGSIRMPAAHNNLVGMRSTVGLSSRYGIVPLANTWDVGGPLTQNVSDLAIIFDVIAGYDAKDPMTARSAGRIPKTYTAYLNRDGLQNRRLGILTNLMVVEKGDEEAAQVIRTAAQDMENAGATVVDVNIDGLEELLKDDFGGYFSILADAATDINTYLASRPSAPVGSLTELLASELLTDQEIRRNLEGTVAFETGPTLQYLQMQAKRETLRQKVHVAMAEANVEALIYPTTRQPPARIGEEQKGTNCFLAGHTQFPAITVPAGFSANGLPLGLEILARKWREGLLIELAYAYEQVSRHRRQPGTTPALK